MVGRNPTLQAEGFFSFWVLRPSPLYSRARPLTLPCLCRRCNVFFDRDQSVCETDNELPAKQEELPSLNRPPTNGPQTNGPQTNGPPTNANGETTQELPQSLALLDAQRKQSFVCHSDLWDWVQVWS